MGKRDTVRPGLAAVHLACADILLAGFSVSLAAEGLHYDLVLDADGRLYRVQVKSTYQPNFRGNDVRVYRFATTRNHRPEIHGESAKIRRYTEDEIDIIACVALDIRRVAYFRVSGVFVSDIHLYPAGTPQWKSSLGRNRRIIDDYPIAKAIGG